MNNKEEKIIEEKTTVETEENTTEEKTAEKKNWKQKLMRTIPSIMAWVIVGAFAIASLITMIILITI